MVCPSDDAGCGRYRMSWPAQALKMTGKDVEVQRRPNIVVNKAKKPPEVMNFLFNCDVAVFQRPASYQMLQLIPLMQKRGIKVVIDMDDDLSCIHPSNPAYRIYDPKVSPIRNWKIAKTACEMADQVTVTTPRLQEVYGGVVVPNCIPKAYLHIDKPSNRLVTVGWAGWVGTHPADLDVTHGAINQAIAKQNARFLALGDVKTFEKLGIRRRSPHELQPGVRMEVYPTYVARFDIGIVPLEDTPFNHAKSWLKALEYASVGVAPVVSPTPDNMRMVEAGAAVAAYKTHDWFTAVRDLITDDVARKNLAEKARTFAADWTIEGNVWRWWDAWGQM